MEMTVRRATEEWTKNWNSFPRDMIEKLVEAEPSSWHEVTLPTIGDRVYVDELPEGSEDLDSCGEIVKVEKNLYHVKLDDGIVVKLDCEKFEMERDSFLPMWGTLWNFKESPDDWWLDNEDGLRQMSKCGFRIYENDEWGYFFGIDGCGYSFMDAHFIPLYKARGLQWHKMDKEECA